MLASPLTVAAKLSVATGLVMVTMAKIVSHDLSVDLAKLMAEQAYIEVAAHRLICHREAALDAAVLSALGSNDQDARRVLVRANVPQEHPAPPGGTSSPIGVRSARRV